MINHEYIYLGTALIRKKFVSDLSREDGTSNVRKHKYHISFRNIIMALKSTGSILFLQPKSNLIN